MKLTTPEQKLIEAAKLDGWEQRQADDSNCFAWFKNNLQESAWLDESWHSRFPPVDYTSYDAIIPLIQKRMNKTTCHSFFDALGILVAKETADVDGQYEYQGDGSYYEQWLLFKATPSQLLDALLLAHGFEL